MFECVVWLDFNEFCARDETGITRADFMAACGLDFVRKTCCCCFRYHCALSTSFSGCILIWNAFAESFQTSFFHICEQSREEMLPFGIVQAAVTASAWMLLGIVVRRMVSRYVHLLKAFVVVEVWTSQTSLLNSVTFLFECDGCAPLSKANLHDPDWLAVASFWKIGSPSCSICARLARAFRFRALFRCHLEKIYFLCIQLVYPHICAVVFWRHSFLTKASDLGHLVECATKIVRSWYVWRHGVTFRKCSDWYTVFGLFQLHESFLLLSLIVLCCSGVQL